MAVYLHFFTCPNGVTFTLSLLREFRNGGLSYVGLTDVLECDEHYVAGCDSILEFFQLMKTIISGAPTVQKIKKEMRLPVQRTAPTVWH